MVEGWGQLPPIMGKCENLKFGFLANFGLLLVETMNPCIGFFCTNRQNPCPTRDSENLNQIALVEFEKNSVEFRKKRVSLMEMRKSSKFDSLSNGVMLRIPPGSSRTVRVRPHNVLGSNRKSGSKSPKIGSPPYFYFRFDH